MKTKKKAILFLVEGITDQESIGIIVDKIVRTEKIIFHITYGDITSYKNTTTTNAIKKVNDHIKRFLDKSFYKKSDLLKVVHLIDTDGAFVGKEYIIEDHVDKFIYSPKEIRGTVLKPLYNAMKINN